jgi:hypothetical protein
MQLTIVAVQPAAAASGSIFVYAGNGAFDEGYTKFGAAAGKPVVTAVVLPTDLSPFDCVILPINSLTFDASQKATFSSYVTGGGMLLALGEHSGFPAANATMNNLATSLGAGLQIIPAIIDGGFTTTTNIDPSTFTVGVNSIRYGATSKVSVSGSAQSLVRTLTTPTTFIAIDKLGTGHFLLSGDSNPFSDNSDTGYTVQDNGVLVKNLCGQKGPGAPASLVLSPKTATNDVDTEHTVTATVKDAAGLPVPGITVKFTVTGAVNTTGQCVTDANGQCSFTYSGPALPGGDAISAFADTNNNGVQDPGPPPEPSDTATKAWVLPASTPLCEIKITNGGWIIARNGDRANFGGNAMADGSGNASGVEEYQDQGPMQPFNLHGDVLAIVCGTETPSPKSGTIFGNATIDGAGSHIFRIDVIDNNEPGVGYDHYRMRVDAYDSGDQVLRGGNIQVHKS